MEKDAERRDPLQGVLQRLAHHAPREGRYESAREIARGGMGAILEVTDPDLRRKLAMKVVRSDLRADGEHEARGQLARFLEEAQITAQLSHPGVVPVHELGLDPEGRVYFTMALVRGRDLRAVLDLVRAGEDGWTLTRALNVLLRVCETMAYAHSKGVIHRDLKPANVMVGEFGEVYVMDWGLARLEGAPDVADARLDVGALERVASDRQAAISDEIDSSLRTIGGAIVGTPSYMSPEQARGDALDARSDVYALGAILYHLLAGRPPYWMPGAGLQALQIVESIRARPPAPVALAAKAAPPELVAICEKAMARDPAARYPTTRELADDLQRYLEGRVVRAHRTGAWIEFTKWVQRNKATAGALGGVLLALVLGGIVAAYTENRRAGLERENAENQRQAAEVQRELRERSRGMADVDVARALDERRDALWPALPEQVPSIEAWIAEAEQLHARLPYQRDSLARLGEIEPDPARQPWVREVLQTVIQRLEDLPAKVEAMRARRALAASIAERTTLGAEARARWRAAADAIATSPRYGGLRIAPQLGLLPLGPDPGSGLWEFWHVLSGDEPPVGPAGGRVLAPESGIVLVLVPAGAWTVGSPPEDEPPSKDEPLFEDVLLDPFFVARHELTQAQCLRVADNPSKFHGEQQGGPLLPVDSLTLPMALDLARRLALEVPTEAQWEVAARGGTRSAYSFGDLEVEESTPSEEKARLGIEWRQRVAAFVNCADETLKSRNPGIADWNYTAGVRDGFIGPAPVGTFGANPFGLFDVHGNVWEWTRDGWSLDGAPRYGDGLRAPLEGARDGAIRGGSWFVPVDRSRSANRMSLRVVQTDQDLGVRFVRRVDG